ncbi:MAG: putative DNA modification/repair radical SAM protein, partial [Myxococcales bacterium]
MNLRHKLRVLAEAARFDASCAGGGREQGDGRLGALGVCRSATPDGRTIALLKVLLSNECIHTCHFCINRSTSDVERATFTPAEIASITAELYRRNLIDGLFLSSGVVRSADHTMEQMAEVARLLRTAHQFGGYIHLKAVPGASPELLDLAGRHADRMSANVELPTVDDLAALAPDKNADDIEQAMALMRQRQEEAFDEGRPRSFLPAGQVTQMMIGATPTPDAVILATAARLYDRHRLRRVYYSAYQPVASLAARDLPAQPPPRAREQRLYEADWLLRTYGFRVDELTTPEQPDLDLTIDPKLAWALRHRHLFPVDVNRAERGELLRVPGLGARSVDRIVAARRQRALRLADLVALGAVLVRARFFVVAADHNPDALLIDRPDLRDRLETPPGQLPLLLTPGLARTTPRVAIADLDDFRAQARALVARGVAPDRVLLVDEGAQRSLDLDEADDHEPLDEAAEPAPLAVPRSFFALCEAVACHRDRGRWAALYRVLYRLQQGERELLTQAHDPDVARVRALEAAVLRDVQRAVERTRLRPTVDGQGEVLVGFASLQ